MGKVHAPGKRVAADATLTQDASLLEDDMRVPLCRSRGLKFFFSLSLSGHDTVGPCGRFVTRYDPAAIRRWFA